MNHADRSPLNLLAGLDNALPEELTQTLLSAAGVRVERIVSWGHASPTDFWYDQSQAEAVLLLAGAARLQFEGEEPFDLRPGDWLDIPAHCRHRVAWTTPDGPTVWLAIHYGQ